MRVALTIAGSDSSGGAGIQGDLKTFAACGVYGTTAITAITAQNSLGITAWEAVSTELVIAQIEAIAADFPPDAVKTGMLATTAIVEATGAAIASLALPKLVVDPVMMSTSGVRLLPEDAVASMIAELFPQAEVVTPNLVEAEALSGCAIRSVHDMWTAARRIRELGPRVVVLKGGHLPPPGSDLDFRPGDDLVDVVSSAHTEFELRGPRIATRHTHGTGCAFAAAIAAYLALGQPVDDAIRAARTYVEGAIRSAPELGSGHGPLNHFWRVY